MKVRLILVLIALALGLITLFSSAYVVHETEQVIITQFGEPKGEPITEAGLYFKTPFVQEVNRIEKRYLPWDGPATEMSTKDKTFKDGRPGLGGRESTVVYDYVEINGPGIAVTTPVNRQGKLATIWGNLKQGH